MDRKTDIRGKIRSPFEKDLESILEIERKSFDNPWNEEKFLRLIKREGFFVYEERGEILGFVIARVENLNKPEAFPPLIGGKNFSHVLNLAVTPEHRREKIGTLLLERVEDYSTEKGIKTIALEVRIGNHSAFKFYESSGFSPEKIIPSYYENGAHAFLMTKTI